MSSSKPLSWAAAVGTSGLAKTSHGVPRPMASEPAVLKSPEESFQKHKSTHRSDEGKAPCILSVRLEKRIYDVLTDLRKQHFPAEASQLNAHVTLFHAIPPSSKAALVQALTDDHLPNQPLSLSVSDLRMNKRGDIILLSLHCPALKKLVTALQKSLGDVLSTQDAQPFRDAHVTLCNKRSAEDTQARFPAIQHALQDAGIVPGTSVNASALDLWAYRGRAPWKHLQAFDL
jgi:2'-5' RNA ligase